LTAGTSPLFVLEQMAVAEDGSMPTGFLALPADGGWAVLWTASEVRWVLSMLLGVAALVVRYVRGDDTVRRRLLWIVLGAGAVLVAVTPWALISGTPLAVLFAIPLLPAGITVAVLRYGLLDVRLVLARSVAYLLLSSLVLAGYALLVLVLSGVASALLVAMLALPLRARLQTTVERVLYGDRSDPARVAAQDVAECARREVLPDGRRFGAGTIDEGAMPAVTMAPILARMGGSSVWSDAWRTTSGGIVADAATYVCQEVKVPATRTWSSASLSQAARPSRST
jgi:hypothetical protein